MNQYREEFNSYLEQKIQLREPRNLYEPMVYIMNLGGKRLRPVLLLNSTALFNGDTQLAMDAALAIEVFHNFSLVHDDIMDDAPLRRGQTTVHEKWDVNTAILSGDAMLIHSYQLLNNYEPALFKSLTTLLSITAAEVCEGQQYDIDFETSNQITIADYKHMISYKTAVLLGASMKMGAIIAKAEPQDQDAIFNFGNELGMAFQIQDDYLDVFGDPKTFGKQVGGDIVENKKTLLYLKALELLEKEDQIELQKWYSTEVQNEDEKIIKVRELFVKCGAEIAIKNEIENHTNKAFEHLNALGCDDDKKTALHKFAKDLMLRNI